MKTVRILTTFEGWPTDKGPVRYTEGQEVEVSNDYADLLVKKGLAREVSAKTAPATKEAAPEKASEKKDPSA